MSEDNAKYETECKHKWLVNHVKRLPERICSICGKLQIMINAGDNGQWIGKEPGMMKSGSAAIEISGLDGYHLVSMIIEDAHQKNRRLVIKHEQIGEVSHTALIFDMEAAK